MTAPRFSIAPNPLGPGFIVLFQYPGSSFVHTDDNSGGGFADEEAAWQFAQKILDEWHA